MEARPGSGDLSAALADGRRRRFSRRPACDRAGARGALRNVTASPAVGQGAACWVAVSPSGRVAYTGNASGSISGFAIGCDGALSSLNTTAPLPSPRDLAFNASGCHLYAVSPGSAPTGALVTSYRVAHDGAITPAGTALAAAAMTGAAAS